MSLPEHSCHPQIIDSVCFLQLIRGNSNPVESLNYTGCFLSIDTQAKRRAPECIRYKLNLFSIICKKPGTGTLQYLFIEYGLPHSELCELSLDRTVRPDNTQHIHLTVVAESEMYNRRGDQLLLIEQSGTDLHLTANTKGVDAVVPAVARCPGPDRVCMIVFRSAVLQPVRESILADHQKIKTLTPLHIEQGRDHSLLHPSCVCITVVPPAVLQPGRESILADHQKTKPLPPLHIEQVRDHSLVHPKCVREITQIPRP